VRRTCLLDVENKLTNQSKDLNEPHETPALIGEATDPELEAAGASPGLRAASSKVG
jgi:hypothetical protein